MACTGKDILWNLLALSNDGSSRCPVANEAMGPVDADVVLVAEHRDGEIDRLECLGISAVLHTPAGIKILQYWIFAGLACHSSGMRPCLIPAFSASVLRCLGGGTTVASMMWPLMAR